MGKLVLSKGEWAWCRRVEGFPVYAIVKSDGGFDVVEVGETKFNPCVYDLPDGTVMVAREYVTSDGALTVLFYKVVGEKPVFVAVLKVDGKAIEGLQAIRHFIAKADLKCPARKERGVGEGEVQELRSEG